MEKYLALLAIVLLIGIVLFRILWLRRKGVEATNFGKLDRTDFLIPPFALFYFYLVFANAFNFPTITSQEFFRSAALSWVGVFFCLSGLTLVLLSLVSLGGSFRVGIDAEHPDGLITTGVFAFSRNPIYLGFAILLLGQFLVFPNWILLVFTGAAGWLFHRQVLREEEFLRKHYGSDYLAYCRRVRRYF